MLFRSDRYRHRNDLTYGEARDMLAASGIFFDLNCDEFERDELLCMSSTL